VTPLTRWIALAASPSGLLAICSAVTAFTIPVAVRCWSSASFTEPRSTAAVTTDAVSWIVA